MADPRAEALLRAMSGGGPEMMEQGAPMEMSPEAPGTPEEAVTHVLTMLEPFMDDPRIAQAASVLQEVVGGPSEMPEDTMNEDAMPML